MAQAVQITPILCPKCHTRLEPPQTREASVQCQRCGLITKAYLFTPALPESDDAKPALPEDATCITHPTKQATKICAGTGDYICSLCAIEVKGEIYSAHYISQSQGSKKLQSEFERRHPRPDREVRNYLLLTIIPPFFYFGFVWLILGLIRYVQMVNLRRTSERYRSMVGRTSVVVGGVLLALLGSLWVLGAGALVMAMMDS